MRKFFRRKSKIRPTAYSIRYS